MEQTRKFLKKVDKQRVMARYFLMKDSIINISNLTGIAPTTLYKWKLQFAEEFKAIATDKNLVQQYLNECKDLSDIINAKSHRPTKKSKTKSTKSKESKTETDTVEVKPTTTVSSTMETGILKVYTHQPIEEANIQTKEEKWMEEMDQKLETQIADSMFMKNTFLSHLKEVEKVHQTLSQQIMNEKEVQLHQAQARIQQLENEVTRLKAVISTLIA